MKKLVLSACVATLLIVSVSSCKKIINKIFPGIDATVPDVTLTVPIIPIVPPEEASFGNINQHFNFDSVVRANTNGAFGAGAVTSVKIKQITISVSNPDDLNNLSNFESARVTLFSNSNTNPVNLATVNFPTTNLSTYTITPTDSPELLDYLKGSELTFNMWGKVRKVTTKQLTLVGSVILTVK